MFFRFCTVNLLDVNAVSELTTLHVWKQANTEMF